MSESDTLRMAAEIVDKFSAPLKELRRLLKQTSDTGNVAHKEGVEGSKKQFESFRKLRDMVKETTEGFRGGFTPAMV